MHIVHVVRQFSPAVGGMETVVWELANAQVASGHSVRVVTLDRVFGAQDQSTLPAREMLAGIEVRRIPFSGSTRYPFAWSVTNHIKNADIVHVHGLDFFFDHLAWTAPFHRRKLVVSTHGGYFHTSFASRLKRIYFSTATRLSLIRYAGVATVSEADDRLFRSVRLHGISLIENGVNVAKYANAAARMPRKAIITLGRFSANKRLDRVIEFVAALRRKDPEWTLKVAGRPGDLTTADLIALADKAGLGGAFEVVPLPEDADIRALMGECSVFASASDYEGFGLAAIEGMTAGLFPLLSNIPPFRRLVERTGVGSITDFSNSEAAAAQFHETWRGIASEYESRRQAAIDASQDYCWSRVSRQYEQLYESVLGTKVRSILDVGVGVSTLKDAVKLLDGRFQRHDPAMVVFANANTLNSTIRSDEARTALQRSIVFNDGIGVNIASRLLFGKWFPENMNGTDFVPNYFKKTKHSYRVFLLGAKPGIAEDAAVRLLRTAPQHRIVGCCHGYLGDGNDTAIVERIRNAKADVLLVAMGDPKQELWLMHHLNETGCQIGFAVGALFDFMAGTVPRAPRWVRTIHMEWCYRMLQEPQRLWRRYLVGMPVFLFRVAGQWIAGARVPGAVRE